MPDDELAALLPRAHRDHAAIEYRTEFEGLWTDRIDVDDVIARRRRAGQLTEADVGLLRDWLERGYVILEGAVSKEVCETVKADLRTAFERGDERLHVLAPGEHFGHQLEPGTDMRGMRVNDIYVHLESARRALFNDPVLHFLRLIFDAAPMLLQSLSFDSGSRQGYHRDTAYVVVDPPMALAASWLALEDVEPGSGELMYIEGSHLISGLLFGDGYKCWNPHADGVEAHDRFMHELVARSEAAGLPQRTLLAREGDVLIWSADLAHGGAPVRDESATRKSLVGHWCPEWAVPRYFDQFPDHAARRAFGGGYYASTHYAIDPVP
jgi:phytanoyl-CoA hydroxylase